jgi:hypothetical protein
MMAKLNEGQLMVLAGMFAVSNMGQNLPDTKLIARAKANPPTTASSCAVYFAGQYMETDEHEAMFTAEVRMWLRDLRPLDMTQIAATWPGVVTAYLGA